MVAYVVVGTTLSSDPDEIATCQKWHKSEWWSTFDCWSRAVSSLNGSHDPAYIHSRA